LPADQVGLQVNDLVRIQLLGGEIRDTHPSRVEDLTRDAVTIAWPTDKGNPVPVVPGQSLLISFHCGGRYYTLAGKVRETTSTPVPVLVVQVQSQIQRIERRDDVRIRAAVPLELREKVVSISEFRAHSGGSSIHASTADISGGGFSIRHRSHLAIGFPFEVTLAIPDNNEPLTLAAKVVRCDRAPEIGSEEFDIGFAFERMSESVRSRIVRFVFTAQISEIQHRPGEPVS